MQVVLIQVWYLPVGAWISCLILFQKNLVNARPVLLTGFGRLFPLQRKLPQVRLNPHNGIPLEGKTIKDKHIMTIRFKLCKALLERLNLSQHSDENS